MAQKIPSRRSLIAGFIALAALVTLFQNCGEAFGVKSQAELQSLSCGDSVPCDAQGFPLGKIVVDLLPPADYPSGTYDADRVESRVMSQAEGGSLSLVRLTGIPSGLACSQTWLRGSVATVGSTVTTELLAGLEPIACRLGNGIPQSEPFLDFLFSSGCFFIETNYKLSHNVTTGAIDLTVIGTTVNDPSFSRTAIPTARIQFRCELATGNP